MLEQLFGSAARVQLLHFFLVHTKEAHTLSEIREYIAVRLKELEKQVALLVQLRLVHTDMRIVEVQQQDADTSSRSRQKKTRAKERVYRMNMSHALYPELRSLFIKTNALVEHNFVTHIKKMGNISYFVLTGFFVGQGDVVTDMLIVGTVAKKKLKNTVVRFEKLFNTPLRYTTMTRKEFLYRREITDRFLYAILEAKNIVVIDEINRS